MMTFEETWQRMASYQGEKFKTIKGLEFTYIVGENCIIPSRTDYQLSKRDVEKAWSRMPLENTRTIKDCRGPSYLYGILMDERLRHCRPMPVTSDR